MLLTTKRKLSPLAFAALLFQQSRSSSRLSSHLASRSPVSLRPSSNSVWVPVKIDDTCRAIALSRVEWRAYYSSEGHKGRCWSCGWDSSVGSDPFLVCGSCRAVQPVDLSYDYFQIFGIERGNDIDEESLERKYKEWQKKLHPDLVHTKSEREKGYAAGQSARVIDAYRTLGKTLSRAKYMLELEGVQVDEEGTISDPEILNEAMEIREAVEEAGNVKILERIRSQIQEKLDFCSSSFAKEFSNRDFDAAVNLIKRMTYYEKAIQEIIIKI